MGERLRITLTEDSSYDQTEMDDETHAGGSMCGDGATLCGMYMVDGIDTEEVRGAITCQQCITALENSRGYKKRNGKWY